MISRRLAMVVIGCAVSAAAAPSYAAVDGWPSFDAKAFEAAQAAGKPILLHVTAPWCPYCKAQKPILSELLQKAEFKDLVTFEIDFDTQKDLLRKFDVIKQSTLISFKGATEVGRSTGDTKASSIEAQLDRSI